MGVHFPVPCALTLSSVFLEEALLPGFSPCNITLLSLRTAHYRTTFIPGGGFTTHTFPPQITTMPPSCTTTCPQPLPMEGGHTDRGGNLYKAFLCLSYMHFSFPLQDTGGHLGLSVPHAWTLGGRAGGDSFSPVTLHRWEGGQHSHAASFSTVLSCHVHHLPLTWRKWRRCTLTTTCLPTLLPPWVPASLPLGIPSSGRWCGQEAVGEAEERRWWGREAHRALPHCLCTPTLPS